MNSKLFWLDELVSLAHRFADYGVVSDLRALELVELWGVYQFLKRIEGGH